VKLRTQFILGMVLFGIVLLVISVSVVHTNREIDRLDAQASTAVNIERATSDLTYLSNDYLRHSEDQQRLRWEARWSSISSELSQLEPNTTAQAAVVERMQGRHDRLGTVFEDVVRTLEGGMSPAMADEVFTEISWSRMAVVSQGLTSDALQLTRLLNQQANEARQTNGILITVLLGTLASFFVLNYLLVSKRALQAVSDLAAGTRIIGSGNLDYSIPVVRRDEIGALTAAFNTMTQDLKGVTASKTELEREVAEREKAEARILRHVATEEGVNRVLTAGLTSGTEAELGAIALAVAVELTQSAFGFVGEIGPDGLLHDVAMSDPGWDLCTMNDKTAEHRRQPGDFEIHGLYGAVIQTGQSLLSNAPSKDPHSIGTPPGHPALTSFLGAPLVSNGQTTGIVAVANREDGYTEEDRESLVALTPAIVEAFLRKRAERKAVQELEISELLLEAAHALAQRADLDSVLQEMIRAVERASGRARVSIGLWDENREALKIVAAGEDAPLPVGHETGRERLMSGVREALITHGPVVLGAGTPAEPALAATGADQASVEIIVPAVFGDAVVGMFLVGAEEGRSLSPREIRVLEGLASQAASGIVKAQLFEAEHRIAETLQAALLDMPASLPGVLLSHRYHSAAEAAKVGGDFYDVLELEEGVLALTVGDISGKGLDAAALTSLVKNTIRAKALEIGRTPVSVIQSANDVLYRSTSSEVFATVFFGVLDTRSGRLVYCNAGHTAAAVMRTEGTLEALTANSPLVGAFPGLSFAESEVSLRSGDSLFLYTDGLTEARFEDTRFGEERLFELLGELAHLEPADLVGHVSDRIAEVSGGTLEDDLAILVVRLLGSDSGVETSLN